jgi:cyclic pyranopterin phosphate synthase
MTATLDRFARPLHDLRISVTDRCNLRCPYCMPKEVFGPDFSFMSRAELLSFEEIARLCRLFAMQGVKKVRLTGGEPLLRRDLESLVAMLAVLEGIDDITLTTNGTLLASKAAELKRAGLRRVTVSLDALDEEIFRLMSDSPLSLRRVLEGIDAASDAGLSPVKVNMVVRRGVNDHCVLDMAEHFRHRPEILRFIEYMDVGSTNNWQSDEVVDAQELIRMISSEWPLEPVAPGYGGEVARRYRYSDGAGEIGLITSVSQPFCESCTRARLSAEGKLYTCLFATPTQGHDLRVMLRAGASDADLERRIREIWGARTDRYSAERAVRLADGLASQQAKIEMSHIGG